MDAGKRRIVTLLAALQALHVAAWGAYYSLTRMVYAGREDFLLALAAAETLPTAAGVLGGAAAERLGYRPVIALGVAEGLLVAAMGPLIGEPRILWLLALAASTVWSIAGPQLYALTLTVSGGSAEKLGLVLAGATLGFSFAAGAAPLAAARLGPGLVLSTAGLLAAASYAAAAVVADRLAPSRAGMRSLHRRLALSALIVAVAAAAYVGTETLGSVYLGRLSREVGTGLYSAANTAAGLLAAAARPLAGRLVDAVGEKRLLPIVLAAYGVYTFMLDRVHGLVFLLLWVAPLYPLLDTSLYKLASAALGEAMGSSLVTSGYSVAGMILACASATGIRGAALAVAGFASASILAAITGIVMEEYGGAGEVWRSRRPRRRPR